MSAQNGKEPRDSTFELRIPRKHRENLRPYIKNKGASRLVVDLLDFFFKGKDAVAHLEARNAEIDRAVTELLAEKASNDQRIKDYSTAAQATQVKIASEERLRALVKHRTHTSSGKIGAEQWRQFAKNNGDALAVDVRRRMEIIQEETGLVL